MDNLPGSIHKAFSEMQAGVSTKREGDLSKEPLTDNTSIRLEHGQSGLDPAAVAMRSLTMVKKLHIKGVDESVRNVVVILL